MNEEEKNLGQRKSSAPYAIVASILFIADALQFILIRIEYGMSFGLYSYVWIACRLILAIVLMIRPKNILLALCFALLSIFNLYNLISSNFVRFNLFSYGLSCLGFLLAALICLANLTDMLPQLKKPLSGLWFLPAILAAYKPVSNFVLAVRTQAYALRYSAYFPPPVLDLLLFALLDSLPVIATLFALLWATHPDGLRTAAPASVSYSQPDGTPGQAPDVMPEAYCGMAKHILLLLFTFGIWPLIWVYRMTRYTNAVKDEPERNPTTKLLLCMFIPFYSIYWTYKTAQRIDKLAAAKSVSSDIATLCLILEFFIPIVPMILMQDKLNSVVTARSVPPQAPQYSQPQEAAYAQPQTASSVADELKTYKDLLDSGILTQEEFDAKKKQLLGL